MELSEESLPLPLFFQYDDLDYFIRNSENGIIGFTGIGIWHHCITSASESKSKIMYYGKRNRMIVDSVHDVQDSKTLWRYLLDTMCTVRDKDESSLQLLNRAMNDYLKGPEWIIRICDADNNRIIKEMDDSERMCFSPICRRDLPLVMWNMCSWRWVKHMFSIIRIVSRYLLRGRSVRREYHTKYGEMRSMTYWNTTLRDEHGRDQEI